MIAKRKGVPATESLKEVTRRGQGRGGAQMAKCMCGLGRGAAVPMRDRRHRRCGAHLCKTTREEVPRSLTAAVIAGRARHGREE